MLRKVKKFPSNFFKYCKNSVKIKSKSIMITKSLRKLIVKEFRRQIFTIAIIAVAAGVGAGIFYSKNNRKNRLRYLVLP